MKKNNNNNNNKKTFTHTYTGTHTHIHTYIQIKHDAKMIEINSLLVTNEKVIKVNNTLGT